MKPALFIAFCFSLFFFSCKKSEKKSNMTTPKVGINFTFDGVEKNFPVAAVQIKNAATLSSTMFAVGYFDNSPEKIELTVQSNSTIAKGAYHNDLNTQLVIVYTAPDNTPTKYDFYGTELGKYNTCTVTVTSITSTNIQGTFNGQLEWSGPDRTIKSITNGTFNLPIQP
ncbi:hypothetical protein FO440_02815 [Mucilaginibacter corticis]|uniref:Uncharacterized protein n=1 Tax=Mucilaginibacter corticis TaxID=2597670 RepID=A0A556MTL5_9SPHI|nr:hypothetical protein [Mucilaginibacter corticis]TSJ43139.1 hypothetical protein FO440_02815 [Mucilaginibacter corticis]